MDTLTTVIVHITATGIIHTTVDGAMVDHPTGVDTVMVTETDTGTDITEVDITGAMVVIILPITRPMPGTMAGPIRTDTVIPAQGIQPMVSEARIPSQRGLPVPPHGHGRARTVRPV